MQKQVLVPEWAWTSTDDLWVRSGWVRGILTPIAASLTLVYVWAFLASAHYRSFGEMGLAIAAVAVFGSLTFVMVRTMAALHRLKSEWRKITGASWLREERFVHARLRELAKSRVANPRQFYLARNIAMQLGLGGQPQISDYI